MFIEKARLALADLDLDLHLIDMSRVLTDKDYYVLDNHMMPSGHEKVTAAILDVIRAR